MAEVTIAGSPQETTPNYVWRGRGLFATYRDQLEYVGGGKWAIPSGSDPGRVYEVRVGVARPSRCECRGFAAHGHCSHVVCASIAHARSATCDSCGERRYWPELRQVEESDELLAWFPGDVLCSGCVAGGAWA